MSTVLTPPHRARARTSPSARSARCCSRPRRCCSLVIVVYPIATLFWNSLHGVDNANPAAGEQWVGLRELPAARSRTTGSGTRSWQTVLYIVVTVPAALVVGLGLALLANKPFRVKWPVRLGLLLPWALPLVFAGLIFRWFFEYQTGVVNDVLVRFGIAPLQLAVRSRRSRPSRSASRSCGSRRRSWR